MALTSEKITKKPKALVLFSGGLDSILAAKILMEQEINVFGIAFFSYFFDARQAESSAKSLRPNPLSATADGLGINLKVVDISREHLKIVKSPKYGYGSAMNPCLDCRILMLKKARQYFINRHFDFVATGEVLGERPMTQNKKSLEITERESLLSGYLLRPLSARLLPLTIPEKEGLIDRKKLLSMSGRSRKKQIELAKKWRINWYPAPAGGCLLTDLEFGKKLKELFEKHPRCGENDITLLKLGRHFWPFDKIRVKIIAGRNEKEDIEIEKLAKKGDILIEMENYPGPIVLVRSCGKARIPKKVLEKAKSLTKYYSAKARHKKDVNFKIQIK